MSLQARTRPSFQAELDLRTAADELMEKEERNVVFVPLNVLLRRDALQSFFFFSGFPEKACAYIHVNNTVVFTPMMFKRSAPSSLPYRCLLLVPKEGLPSVNA